MQPSPRFAHSDVSSGPRLKVAAALAGLAGLGFGIPGAIGMKHLAETGQTWVFMGFPTYGDGPFERIGVGSSVPLLGAFVGVCAAEVAAGYLLLRGSRAGVWLSHGLLPLEAVFWTGFALPFGPPLGIARTLLIISQRRRVDANDT